MIRAVSPATGRKSAPIPTFWPAREYVVLRWAREPPAALRQSVVAQLREAGLEVLFRRSDPRSPLVL